MRIDSPFRFILIASIVFLLSSYCKAQIHFSEHFIDDNTHGTGGIYACDLDNDSDMDVLGASLEDDQIIWWRNDGGNPIIWNKIIYKIVGFVNYGMIISMPTCREVGFFILSLFAL